MEMSSKTHRCGLRGAKSWFRNFRFGLLLALITAGCIDDPNRVGEIKNGTGAGGVSSIGGVAGSSKTSLVGGSGARASGGTSGMTSAGAIAASGVLSTGGYRTLGGTGTGGYSNRAGDAAVGGYTDAGQGSCTPKTCNDYNREVFDAGPPYLCGICGPLSDGCNGRIDCGPCHCCAPLTCEQACTLPGTGQVGCHSVQDTLYLIECDQPDGCGQSMPCYCIT
jgi:hypothetical protein